MVWNKHDTRTFKRPESVADRDVRNCHPKERLHKVERILGEMKDGIWDKERFWIDFHIGKGDEKQKIMSEYYALRDKNGRYLGCMEVSQNISDIQKLTGEKRLLD